MPNYCLGFLIHHAFHSVASVPEMQASKSPTTTIENQLSSVEHLRQALQRLIIAARVTAVFELHKRLHVAQFF